MHYLIYKTTNRINGKFYIGAHQTVDLKDKYLGSGKHLKYAIKKYGIKNFDKEILFDFSNPEEMFQKEAEIVTSSFILREDTYNIKIGGFGGFDWINKNGLVSKFASINGARATHKKFLEDKIFYELKQATARKNIAKAHQNKFENAKIANAVRVQNWTGKTHKKESKQLMSIKHIGSANSMYGKIWIYTEDEKISKRVNQEDIDSYLDIGWLRGRKMKFTGDSSSG